MFSMVIVGRPAVHSIVPAPFRPNTRSMVLTLSAESVVVGGFL